MNVEEILRAEWSQLVAPEIFFRYYENYAITQLIDLPILANSIGCAAVMLKNESNRLKLGSFKGLGGVYAVACILQAREQARVKQKVSVRALMNGKEEGSFKNITFCCASAGNHGIAVTSGAQLFGAKSIVYIADTVSPIFAQRLANLGAEVRRSGNNYEQSMALAKKAASEENFIFLSDSSWQGYTLIPRLIMRGYGLIAQEMQSYFEQSSSNVENKWPTHVFLQAGVGGMAMGITKQIRENWPIQPKIVVVEPESASCLAQSHQQRKMVKVSGAVSIMGRLDCKEPSLLAYEYLSHQADAFICVTDETSQQATDHLIKQSIATTTSGAAGYAAIEMLSRQPRSGSQLIIDKNARCLFIVTEIAL